MATLLKVLPVQNILAEGIQWHVDSQSLWWTDIHSSCLYQYLPASDDIRKIPMSERVGCFAFTPQPNQLVIAFASGIALYDLATQEIKWLARPEANNLGNRLNDGRVDNQGFFWVGSLVENPSLSTKKAQLYRLKDSQCQIMLNDISISNGLCFNQSGTAFYHADSVTGRINQYSYPTDAEQSLSASLFAETRSGASPDGACIDNEGYMWSAHWGASKVVRYAPDGTVVHSIELPVTQPSCVAIGGENFDWLCITTAKEGLTNQQLAQQPQAGNIFIYQLDKPLGLPENICTQF